MDVASSKAQRAEGSISFIRLGIVLFNTALYAAGLTPAGIPSLAWGTIVAANGYSIFMVLAKPEFAKPMRSAAWTTVSDAVLIVVWLSATGAQNSPFVMLWGVSLVAVAFRFGPAATRVATLVYLIADAFLLFAWGQLWPLTGLAVARLAYLAFFGALGSVMAGTILEALAREQKMQVLALELAEKKAEIAAVLESAPSIIIRADTDGKILFINRSEGGIPIEEAVGKSILDFVSGTDRDKLAEVLHQVVSSGLGQSYEVRATLPDGEAIYQSQMGAVMQGTQVAGVVVITVDVTEQVRQRELAQQVVRKENQMRTLRERDQFRSDLLNSVAHELNTPLTPLKLQLRILGSRYEEEPGFGVLERNIDRLAALVSDLLQVARVEGTPGSAAWQTHNLGELIEEAAETFGPIAAENQVTLQMNLDPEAKVEGDQLRLTQILYNLISNAVKYSPSGGSVRLRTGASDGGIRVEVSDDGPGFSPDQLQRLFQPFEQIHATPEGHTGTGLGLYLTKAIVELHGGAISVESPGPGRGSTFAVNFPRPAAT